MNSNLQMITGPEQCPVLRQAGSNSNIWAVQGHYQQNMGCKKVDQAEGSPEAGSREQVEVNKQSPTRINWKDQETKSCNNSEFNKPSYNWKKASRFQKA